MRRSVHGERATIGAHHAERMCENLLQILFAHREARHVHITEIAPQQCDQRYIRLRAD